VAAALEIAILSVLALAMITTIEDDQMMYIKVQKKEMRHMQAKIRGYLESKGVIISTIEETSPNDNGKLPYMFAISYLKEILCGVQ
jgi:hypothetical protein